MIGNRTFAQISESLRAIYAARTAADLREAITREMNKLIPADFTTYNEFDTQRGQMPIRIIHGFEPEPALYDAFARHILEHPLIRHVEANPGSRATRISDVISPRQWHGLNLYNEFFRKVDIEYQMAFDLKLSDGILVGVASSRGKRDFSNEDRELVEFIRPHLRQAYENVLAFEAVSQWQSAAEHLDRGVIVVSAEGAVRLATCRARRMLRDYFLDGPQALGQLPQDLLHWMRRHEDALSASAPPRGREPMVIEHSGKRLTIRCEKGPDGDRLLLLSEQSPEQHIAQLRRAGLTRREAQVLCWTAQGKSNPQIGVILGTSSRTVQKHLENLFHKLRVESRGAASMRFFELVNH